MLDGHCLCGRVRFAAAAETIWVRHCHCESCRRATASPMTTFFAVPNDGLDWTGEVATYDSSPGVTRGFCPTCGSPLLYRHTDRPGETHLYAALLDDPAAVTPEGHDFLEKRLAWMDPPPATPEGEGT